jgi:broad specificity phosphatase PhoE
VPSLHLVRHGRAAAGWDQDADPGLDARGAAQAVLAAEALAAEVDARPIRSSPLRRARETAAPLAARWGVEVVVDAAFGEIPSPTLDLAARGAWLQWALGARWPELGPGVDAWREALLAAVRSIEVDTVAFTHFVAINAVVAAATADDAVTCFLPAHASITELWVEPDDGTVRVVQLGSEAAPDVR